MKRLAAAAVALASVAGRAHAQSVTERGLVEARGVFFPQQAPNDPTRLVSDLLAREEIFVKPASWLRLSGGVDLRASSHDQVEDSWRIDVRDRGTRRPRLSVRRLTATFSRGPVTVDVGKQFIRWGRADIVNPTDRFAPRDFLNVVDSEFLAVDGARAVVEVRGETFDAVWVPAFTPSRLPLVDQRWTAVPPAAAGVPIVDAGAAFPRGAQSGVRWSHVAASFESSVSVFDGFNHLPTIVASVKPAPLGPSGVEGPEIDVMRTYPPIRSYGADLAAPTRWLTVKGEAAYVTSRDVGADEYVLYVIQLERQTGEWMLVGGYAGEVVTQRRAAQTFAPDRGIARSFLGRASFTIDANRSLAIEGAVRQSGDGAYAKAEYSQARGQHWRTTVTGILIRGEPSDFLGQYHRNSHAAVALRYSF